MTVDRARAAADWVRTRWDHVPCAGIILGTGLGGFVTSMTVEAQFPYDQLPHFPRSTAPGHSGCLVCGRLGEIPIVAFSGRFHFYEGYGLDEVTLPVHWLQEAGGSLLVVSNASGGLNPGYRTGDIMLLADHLDLMGRRTAGLGLTAGPEAQRQRPLYDPDLLDCAEEIARRAQFACHRGTYAAVLGPNYETRAEYRMLRRLGADVVGMSTVPEAVTAARLGLAVFALSTVTNVAQPDAPTSTNAQEVVDAARGAAAKLEQLVAGVIAHRFEHSS